MKITNQQLRRIIKEELEAVLEQTKEEPRTPMAILDGKGNLVLINYGRKPKESDYVELPLGIILNAKQAIWDDGGKLIEIKDENSIAFGIVQFAKSRKLNDRTTGLALRSFRNELLNNPRTGVDVAGMSGIKYALEKEGHLGSIDYETLNKNLRTGKGDAIILSAYGRGAPKTIEMYANKETQASYSGDDDSTTSSVVVQDPTME